MKTEQTISVDGRMAYEWVRSVANLLYWADDSLWTGKDDVPYGDPSWMDWRSGLTVDTYLERAREYVPTEIYALYEAWDGEDE